MTIPDTTMQFNAAWEKVVSTHGKKAALSDDLRRMTFHEVDHSAKQVAAWLIQKSIAERCVIILLDNPADSIICMLGVLLSGNYYFVLEKAEAETSLPHYLPHLDAGAVVKASGGIAGFDLPSLTWGDQFDIRDTGTASVCNACPYFAVFSTSGSTGRPKLVRHRTDFLLEESQLAIEIMQITSADRRDYGGSLMFSASLGAIFPTLLAGAELVLHSTLQSDLLRLPDWWRNRGISLTSVPVTVLRTLAKSEVSLSAVELRLIIVTAEAASADDMTLFSARLPPHIVLMNGYATTETRGISISTCSLATTHLNELHTVGRPVPGKGVFVVGSKGEILPAGQSGEIVVEAPGLPSEYLNDPLATQHAFYLSKSGIQGFRTGDTGHFTESGHLVLEGRKDAVVKVNGIKVNLHEIEKILLLHQNVREAAVTVAAESGRIRAFYVADGPVDIPQLRSKIAQTLSPLHIPAQWRAMNHLPKTITGKIDRASLKAEIETETQEAPENEEVNSDQLVAIIRQVWKKELGLTGRIGLHDDFFTDLGGNSLLSAVCIHEFEQRLGLSIPVGAGNTYSTPALLAAFLRGIHTEPAHCVQLGNFDPAKPNLYFIPPYPGDRRTYHQLESRLAHRYNLFFLFYNPIDSSGNLVPLSRLVDSLAHQVASKGETHLFGFSFGGIMAYLLAMKLEERNQPVSCLTLIDTPLYRKLSRLERARNFSVRIARKAKQFVRHPFVSWNHYVRNFQSAYTHYRENFTSEKHKEDPTHPSQVIWQYSQSFPSYQRLNARIVLFKASETSGEYLFRQDYNWQRYTRKKLQKVPLDGWHVELLGTEENLDRIRETLVGLV